MSMKRSLFVIVLGVLLASPIHAGALPGPVVDTQWLADHQGEVVVLSVMKGSKGFTSKPLYRTDKKSGKKRLVRIGGHLPGARLLDYGKIRGKVKIAGRTVDKMAIPASLFEKVMQGAGINQGDSIVLVSAGLGNGDITMATRAYWQIKYFGHDEVAILDGGLAAWLTEGRPVESTPSTPARGDWKATAERREMLATSEDVARVVASGGAQLMDNRPISLYLGIWRKSYVYDKGHIPGAKVFPNEILTTPRPARLLSADQYRTLLKEMGFDPEGEIITYCNSGHLASGGWFIVSEILGGKARLYDGSMHQWTLEKRPVTAFRME